MAAKKATPELAPEDDAPVASIQIQRIQRRCATMRVTGTAPLIIQRFSEKARRKMLDSQQGKNAPKENRNPEADFEAAIHRLEDGRHGITATSFKAATVGAARHYGAKVTMTVLRSIIYVKGTGPNMLVPLESNEPKMFEAPVRNSSGVADLRFRPLYDEWGAVLSVVYVPSILSLDSLVSLVDAGGMGGVGEWRPASKQSNTGIFGTYVIDDSYTITDAPA